VRVEFHQQTGTIKLLLHVKNVRGGRQMRIPSEEIENWESEYDMTMNDGNRTVREQEILEGSPLKTNEGMIYGRMYADWKKRKGYE
tara:strand:- start:172 stop:429 length:258 start_codon:yes stop_codon:yes gene_type:complete